MNDFEIRSSYLGLSGEKKNLISFDKTDTYSTFLLLRKYYVSVSHFFVVGLMMNKS